MSTVRGMALFAQGRVMRVSGSLGVVAACCYGVHNKQLQEHLPAALGGVATVDGKAVPLPRNVRTCTDGLLLIAIASICRLCVSIVLCTVLQVG